MSLEEDAERGRAFLRRVNEGADAEGRLPLGAMAEWEVFPFERDSLRVRPMVEFALPEPDRSVAAEECPLCQAAADPDRVLGGDDDFAVLRARTSLVFSAQVVTRAHRRLEDLDGDGHADLGRWLGAAYDALRGLPGVGRVHLNKWENGKGHLSFALNARPAGVLQLRGSNLAAWADLLPETPREQVDAHAEQVRRSLDSAPS